MVDILLLRLDAPLVSFGATAVDNINPVERFPPASMLVGLLGNALGVRHGQTARLQRLQERLRYAARCDRPGEALIDYQTVDLGQSFMLADEVGWTTRGSLDERGGGSAKTGTHIRYRHARADSVHTVALTLTPEDEDPNLEALAEALRFPARPLFVGRKACLPASPLLLGRTRARGPLEALTAWPRLPKERSGWPANTPLPAWWSEDDPSEGAPARSRLLPVTDERDWSNQVHCGRRFVRHGQIEPPESDHGA